MIRAAFAFLILALPAWILGFSGFAETSSITAQILLLALMVMSLVMLMLGQRSRRDANDWHASTSGARAVMARAAGGRAPIATRTFDTQRVSTVREAGGRTPTTTRTVDTQRVLTVREAFNQQRLARVQRRLSMFYIEHNLFEQARESRLAMIGHLRSACQQWRQTIGASS